jgi:phosphate:Na+ symporter
MLSMAKELVHTPEKKEDFTKIFSRLEKYEDIADRMEVEIAEYLNRCAEGRLSNEGKHRISCLLRMVSEIESIADGCFSVAKAMVRKQQGNVEFPEVVYNNIDAMFGYVEEAMNNMMVLLKDVENARKNDIIASYNKEREINNLRAQLRTDNIENINNKIYEYPAGIVYMDIIGDLEKTGDYIINVVDAVKDQVRKNND